MGDFEQKSKALAKEKEALAEALRKEKEETARLKEELS